MTTKRTNTTDKKQIDKQKQKIIKKQNKNK